MMYLAGALSGIGSSLKERGLRLERPAVHARGWLLGGSP